MSTAELLEADEVLLLAAHAADEQDGAIITVADDIDVVLRHRPTSIRRSRDRVQHGSVRCRAGRR